MNANLIDILLRAAGPGVRATFTGMMLAIALSSLSTHGQTVYAVNAVGYVNVAPGPGLQWIANPLDAEVNTVGALLKDMPEGTTLYSLDSPENSSAVSASDLEILSGFFGRLLIETPELVQIQRTGSTLRLEWFGTLVGMEFIDQPGQVLNSATSSLEVSPTSATAFWRAYSPPIPTDAIRVNVYQDGAWSTPNEPFPVGVSMLLMNPASTNYTITFVGEVLQGELTNIVPEGFSFRSSMVPQTGGLTSELALEPSIGDAVWLDQDGQIESYMWVPPGRWAPEEPVLNVGQGFMIHTHTGIEWVRPFSVNP